MKLNSYISNLHYIKLSLLFFLACWFFLAALSNLGDFLVANHFINDITFRSNNYTEVQAALAVYSISKSLLNIIFIAILVIEFTSALLFSLSFFRFLLGYQTWFTIHLAFMLSMGLWASFLLSEELLIFYKFEAVHLRWLTFEIVSFLVLHLLPDRYQRQVDII
ncbi:hypothetical protein ACNVED_11810 [Legionella sp. D16C41]|uniref:hypothetical protein n=1 Tax=Legionella sp. D16C41 TaxID=3402688 RepID=UPI003AF86E45